MANMKVKLIIDDEIKGVFINPINITPKRKEEKVKQPLLKTSISRNVDAHNQYQDISTKYNSGEIINNSPIISRLVRQSEPAIRTTEETIKKFMKSQNEITPIPEQEPESDNIADRASTEEEMFIFDSIESIPENERTENERNFMKLYENGVCPLLDVLEKALIPIRIERKRMEDELEILNYINSYNPEDWTDTEKNLVKAINDGNISDEDMMNTIARIKEEKALLESEVSATLDLGPKYKQILKDDESFERIKSNKKNVLKEY